ncbi:MAG: PaaI family thioesterase [Oscillospiraceae bacterium]|nr:PaaI family thioesterase [Oscillospiraceae bacterium]
MSHSYDLKQISDFFANDRFAAGAGCVIDAVSEETVVCSVEVTPQLMNAAGSVQGGAIFTLADLCFAVHCNLGLFNGSDAGITVGQSCSISFLKSPRGKKLIAKSRRVSAGRTMSVFEIEVADDRGSPCAVMVGNAFTTAKR